MPRGQRKPKLIPAPEQTFQEDPPRVKDGDLLEGAPGPDHNGRLESLDEMLGEFIAHQRTEDALMKLHIDPVREAKAKVKARAKADFDIPTEAFNARAAMRKIELKEQNDEVVVAFNELLEATPFGKSVDLFAARDRVAAKKAEEAKAAAEKKTKVTAPTEKSL